MIPTLKIKKSHKKGYILYNPDNFALHTHCHSLRVALVIRDNVLKHRLPISRDKQMIISHLRVTNNKSYRRKLEILLDDVVESGKYEKKTRK